MVIDSSALVAVLLEEPEHERMKKAIAADGRRLVSAASVLETAIVLEARSGEHASRQLDLLLRGLAATIVAVDADQANESRAAWERFGKGRHPASLDFGDCFVYALAKTSREPLLFKGDDFSKTDLIEVAY